MSPERRKRLAKRIKALRSQLRMVRSSARLASALITLCGLKSRPTPFPITCRAIIEAAEKKRRITLEE